MIPEFDVPTAIHVDFDALRPPASVQPAGSAGYNGDHVDLTRTSWAEAIEALTEETQWLAEANEASTTVDEFEEHLYETGQDDPDTQFVTMAGLDVGVAGLVLALSAAGYLPWISCSAHGGGTKIPQVGLYASAPRAMILIEAAQEVGCGIEDRDGGLWIFARSVLDMNRLAHALVEARDQFGALPDEPWTLSAAAEPDEDEIDGF